MKHRIGWLLSPLLFSAATLLILFTWVNPIRAADLTVGVTLGCSTIQSCIDTAVAGDTVLIPAGVYIESLSLNNKAVSLIGAGTSNTTIRATSGQRVLTITGATINSDVIISGLRMQNGNVNGGNSCSAGFVTTNCGGGILITGNAQPSLSNLIIRNNSAYRGGGLFVDEGSFLPTLSNVTLYLNTSTLSGGGAYFAEAVMVNNGRFEANVSTNNVAGGAIFYGDTILNNTIFKDNETCTVGGTICHAGGLYAFEVNLTVNNSRFENNRCQELANNNCDGGGLYWSRSFNEVLSKVVDWI